ncbi:MAG TPA: hypothetical protein VF713_24685 [Thermoanaerobaculia bacterium]
MKRAVEILDSPTRHVVQSIDALIDAEFEQMDPSELLRSPRRDRRRHT